MRYATCPQACKNLNSTINVAHATMAPSASMQITKNVPCRFIKSKRAFWSDVSVYVERLLLRIDLLVT